MRKLFNKYVKFSKDWATKYAKNPSDPTGRKIFKWIMRNYVPCLGWALVANIIFGLLTGFVVHVGVIRLAFCFLPLRFLHINPILFLFKCLGFVIGEGDTPSYHSSLTGYNYSSYEAMRNDEIVWHNKNDKYNE